MARLSWVASGAWIRAARFTLRSRTQEKERGSHRCEEIGREPFLLTQVIREKFEAHKDGQEGSELRNKYEE